MGFLLLFLTLFCIPINSLDAATTKPITKVVIEKSKRQMHLLNKDEIIESYTISLGGHPKGHKQQEGDQRTPEGTYTIDWRNPKSQFRKSLHISYPNAADKANAKKHGVSPGGAIFIHGLGSPFGYLGKLHTQYDWTLGCIAVTNEEIDEVWELVKNGTPIEIKP